MSPVIDNRVVEMEFDNSRFERNVSTSISTLDKLKAALRLDGASKGLESIENTSRNFNLAGIGTAVETISSRFSALGVIGTTILQDIGHKAFEAGQRVLNMINNLTFAQVKAGWDKYGDYTSSVATIMSATEKTWENSAKAIGFVGSQMDFVNSQMDKLNWFTDETSYSFTDMVSNIGKFTSMNIPLEESVTAMIGIANWAAISGKKASDASHAMYNLSQAIGQGSVQLMDWKSITNVNMDTAVFKERVLEIAAANGQLKKSVDSVGNAVYQTAKGTTVSIENFQSTLSEKWFDKKTLLGVLNDYGNFTNELFEFTEATGLTATEILNLVEANKKGALSQQTLNKAIAESGLSTKDFKEKLDSLSSAENDFGYKAFKAGQQARTFSDAIEATADAASSAWLRIYKNLFGNVEQATKLWSGFTEFLYDALVSPLDKIEQLSQILGNIHAVERIGSVFSDIFAFIKGNGDDVVGILGHLREGFQNVFPPLDDGGLLMKLGTAIGRIQEWAKSLEVSFQTGQKLERLGEIVGNVVKGIGNTFSNLWSATEPLRTAISGLVSSVSDIIQKFITLNTPLNETAGEMLSAGLSGETLRKVCELLARVINRVSEAISKIDIDELKKKFSGVSAVLKGLKSAFDWIVDKLTSIDFASGIGKAIDWIKEKFSALKEYLSGFDWGGIFKGLAGGGILTLIGTKIIKALMPKKGFLDGIKEKITGVLDGVKDALGAFEAGVKIDGIKKIAEAILILAAALLILGFVNYDNAVTGLFTIAGILGGLYLALQNIDTIDKAKMATLAASMLIAAAAMLVLAVALGVLAGALALFALVANMEKFGEGLGAMVLVLFAVVAAMEIMSKMSPKVLIAAAALLVIAAALIALALALAGFALVAKMGADASIGLMLMVGVLTIVVSALIILGKAMEDSIPSLLSAAAALLIASAALLVLAAALAAFALVAKMGKDASNGLTMLVILLTALTVALIALGKAGPAVLAGAASLLVAAAACLVLAAAVAVVGLALPLLAIGLAALGAAIGSALTSIGQGAQDFLVSLSDALVAIGDALAEIITSIADALGGAVATLGEGIAEAIADIIASVGKGIGDGITYISDAIGTFGENLTNAGLGIENLGNSVRSLEGISWTSTAVGIGEVALALKKLNGAQKGTNSAAEFLAEFNATISSLQSIDTGAMQVSGAALIDSFIIGMQSKTGNVSTAVTLISMTASVTVSGTTSNWYSAGVNLGQGLVNGILSKLGDVQNAAAQLANAAASALAAAAQIRSPSRVTTRLGGFFGQGFVNGIDNKIGAAEKAAETMVNRTANTLSNARSLISSILEDDFTPVISPVLDTSSIDSSLAGMAALNVPMSGNFVQRTSASVTNPAQIQNGTPAPVTAVLSESAARALAGSHSAQQTPVIEFSGDLAQLARILQPHIKMQDNYHGKSLVR